MEAKPMGVSMMGLGKRIVCASLICSGALLSAAEQPEVVYKELQIGGLQEFGQIVQGTLYTNDGKRGHTLHNEWVDHFGAFITQEALVERRLKLQAGIGIIFQFPKEEKPQEGFGGSQYKMGFVGPTIAKGEVLFGNPENPYLSIGGGMFPFKYNQDAVNLGEYLLRSAPYPSLIYNGNVLAIGDNSAYMQGFHANFNLNNFNLDLLLTSETGYPPLYDWSATALAAYKTSGGTLEIGAGVKLHHIFPVRPSRTQQKISGNSYFSRNGVSYSGNPDFYRNKQEFLQGKYDKGLGDTAQIGIQIAVLESILDSMGKPLGSGGWQDTVRTAAGLVSVNDRDGNPLVAGAKFYDNAGTLLMARFALSPMRMLETSFFKPNDFKLFAEIAVLGVKNYPVFYEKMNERVPIMLGVNLPTFGVLDLFAIQVEQYGNKFLNNSLPINTGAIPFFPGGGDTVFSKNSYLDLAKDDDISWSILLRRSFLSSFSVNAQIARDHMRTVGTDWYYGPVAAPIEATARPSDWYWMLQFAWSI